MKSDETSWKVSLVIFIFLLSGGVFYLIPNISSSLYELFENIESLGVWGFFLFSLVYGFSMILAIPVAMTTVSLSFLYNFLEANAICNIGTAIGTFGSFILGRTLLKDYCQE